MFVTSTTNQKTQVWQKRALHCTCWDMKLCSFAVSTATQSLLFWMPGAAKRNTVCGVNGHQFGLSWSMLAEALTLCAAPLFGFSPPLGSSVWKPNLWETCCHVECRDTCDSVGTVRQEKRVYLDGVLWKFDFSWQFLPRVHVCIVAVGKLWSGGRKVVFNCLLVETFSICDISRCIGTSRPEATLLKCPALLRGEGGTVSVLDVSGFLVKNSYCLHYLRMKICKLYIHIWHQLSKEYDV